MPLREYGCSTCGLVTEKFHWPSEPLPTPTCCGKASSQLWSVPNLDTSSTFRPFVWRSPTGLYHEINTLHDVRQVEKAYSDRCVRFDAWSAEPSNPDVVDGFGPEYWDGNSTSTSGKAFALPTMDSK